MTVKEAERLGIMRQVDKKEFTIQQASEQMEVGVRQGKMPRQFSIRPVLIHVNGIEESVLDERYFDKVIDLSQLLDGSVR